MTKLEEVVEKDKIKKKVRAARKKKIRLTYEEFEEVFSAYDRDGNGKLQYGEINNLMKDLLMRIERTKKSFKKGLTEKEMYKYSQDVAKLIERYDEDRSGTLDKKEVAKLLNVKIPLKDRYTLNSSVKSKSKLFEEAVVVDAPGECVEMSAGTCHDMANSDIGTDSGSEEEEPQKEEPQKEEPGRAADLLRHGALKMKSVGGTAEPISATSSVWLSVQKQSFTEWVERKLNDNGSEYIVMDLIADLGDGVLVPELARALTKKNISYREDPKLTFHRYENIRISLSALNDAGCTFSMDVAGDLVSGNEKLCLSFTKILLSHFGGRSLQSPEAKPQPGLRNVLNSLQARLRTRSGEQSLVLGKSDAQDKEQEPAQAKSDLFLTRSTVLPDWPPNRSRSQTPEKPSSRPASRTPERAASRPTSTTPERAASRPTSVTPERAASRPESRIPQRPSSITESLDNLRAGSPEKHAKTESIASPSPISLSSTPTGLGMAYSPDICSKKKEVAIAQQKEEEEKEEEELVKEEEEPPQRKQPDPSLSSDKKLEFFLVRGPPPAVEKSRLAVSQTESTPKPAAASPVPSPQQPPFNMNRSDTVTRQFNPVMSQLKLETKSRQADLEKHTTTSDTPYQVRGRESFLGLGSPARVKMKHASSVIPQFKQNVVNGLTEIISQVNKLVEEDHERVNNLTADWADGQIILMITEWFCPGILETYKHDHSLVKIGVSLAALKQLLDVGTEITPMDMHMSRIEMRQFRMFLSQVLWKDRARHSRPFSRNTEILSKEKEMRNVGMISASLNRKQKLIPPPRSPPPPPPIRSSTPAVTPYSIRSPPAATPSSTWSPTPAVTPYSIRSPPAATRKGAPTSPTALKKSLLSKQFVPREIVQLKQKQTESRKQIPPKHEPFHIPPVSLKPAFSPSSKTESTKEVSPAVARYYQISGSAPIIEDTLLSTIPPAKPPRPKFNAITSNNMALEDDCILSTIPKRSTAEKLGKKKQEQDDKETKPLSKDYLDESQIQLAPEPEAPARSSSMSTHHPAPVVPARDASLRSMTRSPDHPTPGLQSSRTNPPVKHPTETSSRFTVTPQQQAYTFKTAHGTISHKPQATVKPMTNGGNHSTSNGGNHSTPKETRGAPDGGNRRTRHDTFNPAHDEMPDLGDQGAEDHYSIDSLEQQNIEFNKNISKMIAGFISNEQAAQDHPTDRSNSSDSASRPKKRVRFREGHEEYESSGPPSDEQGNDEPEKEDNRGTSGQKERLDKVNRLLAKDLAAYFSTSVDHVETGDLIDLGAETRPAESTTLSPELADYLPSQPRKESYQYDLIDVEQIVSKSLSEAGIASGSNETEHQPAHLIQLETTVIDEALKLPLEVVFTESEPKQSYFDIMCKKSPGSSRSSVNSSSDDSVVQPTLTPMFYKSIPK